MPHDIDLLAGGPPCQPFSLAGRSLAYGDKRGMFPAFSELLAHIMPRAFICENVAGLMRASFHDYFSYILLRLQYPTYSRYEHETWEEHAIRLSAASHNLSSCELHYNISTKLVDAADYGVPQHRRRVFIVGFRSDVSASWSFPHPTHGPNKLPWLTLGSAIQNLPLLNNEPHPMRAQTYPGHTGSTVNLPSKTIKAGTHGVPGGENMIRFPDDSLRYMSVREAARIQTFPDDYEFCGSWSSCMRQIGNAVPVELARIVAESVKYALG